MNLIKSSFTWLIVIHIFGLIGAIATWASFIFFGRYIFSDPLLSLLMAFLNAVFTAEAFLYMANTLSYNSFFQMLPDKVYEWSSIEQLFLIFLLIADTCIIVMCIPMICTIGIDEEFINIFFNALLIPFIVISFTPPCTLIIEKMNRALLKKF